MKNSFLLLFSAFLLFVIFPACRSGNNELREESAKFATAMCRNVEIMQRLKATAPTDTALIAKIQKERLEMEQAMQNHVTEFMKKYGEKSKDPAFMKEYRKYLNEAMLDCRYLSKEDRANFEREIKGE